MKSRQLATGRRVAVHDNHGLRKRCGCPRRTWLRCAHVWHFAFKWAGVHHRFPLDEAHVGRLVTTKDGPDGAKAEADRLRAAIRSGQYPPPAPVPAMTPEALTFRTFAERWQKAVPRATKQSSANDNACLGRLFAVALPGGATLGDSPIGALTEDVWETSFAALSLRAGSTWNKYRGLLLALQHWGQRKGYLTRPWLGPESTLTRKRGAQRSRRLAPDVLDDKGKVIEPGEERRLLAVASTANPWLYRLIVAALETGCRRGELLALQWRDVRLTAGELTIRAETTKTRTGRVLPISPRLRAVLDFLRRDEPQGQEPAPLAHVFGDRAGAKVVDPKKAWAACCRRAGVTGLTFHDLRHEAGSRFVEDGWPVHHVQAMLGHADLKTTSTYLNLTRTGLAESMRKYGRPLHDVAPEAAEERPPSVQQAPAKAPQPTIN